MPSCTDQAGYDLALSVVALEQLMVSQQCLANIYLAAQGTPPANMGPTGFTPTLANSYVVNVYQKALGRTPQPTEQATWAYALLAGSVSAGAFAQAVMASPECYARFGCA